MSLAEFDEVKYNHTAARLDAPSSYLLKKARRKQGDGLADLRKSLKSATIYIGNLSFYTSEEQIYELFSKVGRIEKVIMGLDKFKYTPCGFCFIIFSRSADSINAVKYLNGTKLDDQILEIDLDPGFKEDRQFGRGQSGGQVRHEVNRYEPIDYSYQANFENTETPNYSRFGSRRQVDEYIPGSINGEEQQQNQQKEEQEHINDTSSNMDVDLQDAPN